MLFPENQKEMWRKKWGEKGVGTMEILDWMRIFDFELLQTSDPN